MKKKYGIKGNIGLLKRGPALRLVIPDLTQYRDHTADQLNALKHQVLNFLQQSQKNRLLQNYCIAVEHHPTSGIPHLDILLVYEKSVQTSSNRFDSLIKHGNVTVYRKLNEAILNYGKKQDLQPLTNLPEDTKQILILKDLVKDPYAYLEDMMLQDPLHFKLADYALTNNLSKKIKSWTSIKTKLRDIQQAAAHIQLRSKPGFKLITRQLIQSTLTSDQLKIYDSWSGYQTIVNYLNQIPIYGYKRPMKTMNLMITGPPSIGKTALFTNRYALQGQNPLSNFVPIYPMGTKNWWPSYKSEIYKLLLWNQAKLTTYSYDTILRVLEGSEVDLPQKGTSVLKYDNPLVVMLSNMTLNQLIQQKFNYSLELRTLAQQNLKVRIQNVIVPTGFNLFLLQKLLVPLEP